MAAPNVANLTTITAKTAVANVSTAVANVIATSTNQALKINSIIVSNIDGTIAADVSVSVYRSTVDYYIARTISVPADASLVVTSKDSQIYLEESDAIRALASANSSLQIVISYEILA